MNVCRPECVHKLCAFIFCCLFFFFFCVTFWRMVPCERMRPVGQPQTNRPNIFRLVMTLDACKISWISNLVCCSWGLPSGNIFYCYDARHRGAGVRHSPNNNSSSSTSDSHRQKKHTFRAGIAQTEWSCPLLSVSRRSSVRLFVVVVVVAQAITVRFIVIAEQLSMFMFMY